MKNRIAAIAIAALALSSGCTDAQYERTFSINNKHRIDFYSGGVKVATWVSTGTPRSVADEDGWMFVDNKTGRLITVTGDVVIETLPDDYSGGA